MLLGMETGFLQKRKSEAHLLFSVNKSSNTAIEGSVQVCCFISLWYQNAITQRHTGLSIITVYRINTPWAAKSTTVRCVFFHVPDPHHFNVDPDPVRNPVFFLQFLWREKYNVRFNSLEAPGTSRKIGRVSRLLLCKKAGITSFLLSIFLWFLCVPHSTYVLLQYN